MKIKELFKDSKGRYGATRIQKDLIEDGSPAAIKTISNSMRRQQLIPKAAKKFKVTTDSDHQLPIADNLLERDFSADAPNQKWVQDITYLWTSEDWLYLAVVIDLYSRAVVGWSMNRRMKASLVTDALTMAMFRRVIPKGVIIHSDRGNQYCSHAYRDLASEHDFKVSMSRKGDCWGRVENWRAHLHNHVSSPRSSNRTCATNASGFRSKYHAFALDTSAIVCGIA